MGQLPAVKVGKAKDGLDEPMGGEQDELVDVDPSSEGRGREEKMGGNVEVAIGCGGIKRGGFDLSFNLLGEEAGALAWEG